MESRDIRKLSEAKLKVMYAERGLTTTKNEVFHSITDRAIEIREQRENMTSEEIIEEGMHLVGRFAMLMDALWSVEEHDKVTTMYTRPDYTVKRIDAPGYIRMHLTQNGDTEDMRAAGKAGTTELTDAESLWKLHNVAGSSPVSMLSPREQVLYEDDIHTLEGILFVLDVEVSGTRFRTDLS